MKNLINYDLEEIENPRKRNEYSMTTNRSVYKKCFSNREKYCSFCGWNRGCNARRNKFYGGEIYDNGEVIVTRYPSWKFYKKTKKQWVYSPLKKDVSEFSATRYSLDRDYAYFSFIKK